MNTKQNRKTIIILTMVIGVAALIFLGYFIKESKTGFFYPDSATHSTSENKHSSGKIFLYGETHSVQNILEKEFELWSSYYHNDNMRDLFVELPYYTAEYLNVWMHSDDDDILDILYQDWAGTAISSQEVIDFYKQIKSQCPETVFHGTDVGHQYGTTGKRFLEYLESGGQEQSELYKHSLENMEQGQYYYQHSDPVYRENAMTENFIREFDSLRDKDVMGIYGSAHTGTEATDYETNSVPCMANQLHKIYGDALYTEDLTSLALNKEACGTDVIQIGGKEYTALYFGKEDLTTLLPDYQCREFWRLEDAYNDFKGNPVTGNVLPYHNYPMKVETGQIFVIDYTKADGSVVREYHRSDGNTWNGYPVTEEILMEN